MRETGLGAGLAPALHRLGGLQELLGGGARIAQLRQQPAQRPPGPHALLPAVLQQIGQRRLEQLGRLGGAVGDRVRPCQVPSVPSSSPVPPGER
ncbi:hypothetical protein [Streptomyces sp. WMMC940]|uniref:hypothetical protein n=1 Tax=Streptomyces sp. WMMC940 TaxID=3015153 RepID=UPI0022B645FB|nr:hypothetical protein [Streptomyces sp. WMMC940]MCZ7457347.1 hypothetical protein [Streptomyces sp. WMMC940]